MPKMFVINFINFIINNNEQPTSGFAATWAGQTIFSIGSLPIIGYGLDR
jgi:hypothetical protein